MKIIYIHLNITYKNKIKNVIALIFTKLNLQHKTKWLEEKRKLVELYSKKGQLAELKK